ncbi:thioredoxin domain-containing protein [Cephus cinctus]|uniref:Thioredoxin domain-containing protein n=1 Tax=Cephus cinctus TaxID=211228 RepID=A0AAJ7CDM3_CEPCN|nr:thioredoxin domain-containing protein [Cephus cinctus]
MICYIFLVSILLNSQGLVSSTLETVNDDDLLNLIKSEKYVIVLFTKKNCEECDNFENELIHLREDLVDSLSSWVVKAVNSQLLRLYSPNKEPALVFFRHGIPLLYDGPLNDEEILTMFMENKDPIVKELTDDTFEHLTQASSGATTGDWFIMFYSTDCVECQRLGARWETVGAKLKQKLNVARVNKYTTGASTARRFNVFEVPEFIFFRQGKMYRYQIPRYDVNSFVSFAKDWYRNTHGEKVPHPQSPFDDVTQMIANFLHENPWVMKLGSISIGVLVIVSVASKLRGKSETSRKKDT